MSKRRLSDDADESVSKVRKVDHDGKLNFFNAPSSLKDMAAIKITIALWYHQNIRDSRSGSTFYGQLSYNSMGESYIHMPRPDSYYCDSYDHSRSFRQAVLNSIGKLPIPPKLLPCIESNVELIERQLKNWFYYHEQRIFFQSDYSHLANDLIDEIIWRSDGYIDYMATAENLLESLLLSDVHKFRVMCTYCMEDEIVQLPNCIISPKYLNLSRVTLNDHPLIFYWNFYLKRGLDKIEFSEATSLENYMINKVDNWAAIEYFFDQLNVDDQVVKAIALIRSHGLKYQSRVLSKLNESQQHRVFMDCAKSILMNCLDVSPNKSLVFDLWDRCLHLITGKEFFDIFEETGRKLAWSSYYKKDARHTISLLIVMWTTAPAELKKNVESLDFDHIFKELFRNNYSCSVGAEMMDLLLVMLPDASSEYKNEVLIYGKCFFFCRLLKDFELHYLDKLLKIICSDAKQVADEKKSLMHSENFEEYCSHLIQEGNLTKLNDILTMLLPDTEKIDYKMKILESQIVFDFFIKDLYHFKCENLKKIVDDEVISLPPAKTTDYKLKLVESKNVTDVWIPQLLTDQCKKLREVVDDVFGSDRNSANSSILRICLLNEAFEKFHEKINAGEFNRVKNSLEQLITQKEDLKAVKDKLLHSYVKIIRKGVFSIFRKVEWEEFLTWCATDLKEFRKLFNEEELFNKMLIKSVFVQYDTQLRNCRFREKCCFNGLDAFLSWYFDTPQEIKEYKIDKAFNFERMESIEVLLRKTEKYYLRTVFAWFFDKDYEVIKKFRTVHAKHKISRFV